MDSDAVYVYNTILFNHKKKRWNNMDRPWVYYAKWNKSDGKRQMPYGFTHMRNIKNKITKPNIIEMSIDTEKWLSRGKGHWGWCNG